MLNTDHTEKCLSMFFFFPHHTTVETMKKIKKNLLNSERKNCGTTTGT